MPAPEAPTDTLVRLRVDADDRIVAINSAFERFARDNDAAGLDEAAVLGRTLSSFIADDETRTLLALMLRTVRELNRETQRIYRCDSPDTRRLMRMRLIPLAGGGVEMEHSVLATEPLRHRLAFTTAERALATALRCSLCNRVRLDGTWRRPDDLPDGAMTVYYGICEDCRAGLAPAL